METFDILKNSILELTDHEEVAPEMKMEDIGLDSLDYVSIQLELKKQLGVQLDFEHLTSQNMSTLNDFSNYVDTLVSVKRG